MKWYQRTDEFDNRLEFNKRAKAAIAKALQENLKAILDNIAMKQAIALGQLDSNYSIVLAPPYYPTTQPVDKLSEIPVYSNDNGTFVRQRACLAIKFKDNGLAINALREISNMFNNLPVIHAENIETGMLCRSMTQRAQDDGTQTLEFIMYMQLIFNVDFPWH